MSEHNRSSSSNYGTGNVPSGVTHFSNLNNIAASSTFPGSLSYIPKIVGEYFESYNPTFQYQKRKMLNAWNQSDSHVQNFNPFFSQYSKRYPRFHSIDTTHPTHKAPESYNSTSTMNNELVKDVGTKNHHAAEQTTSHSPSNAFLKSTSNASHRSNLTTQQSKHHLEQSTLNPLQLVKLQIFIRHGPRTYMTALPNYTNAYGEIPWKCPPFVTEYIQEHHFFKSDIVKSTPASSTKNLSFNIFYQEEDNRLKGNCGTGQLTEIGWNYMERIGNFLRYRYGKLDPNDTYVRTTDSHPRRTEDTTKAILMGWMPEVTSWNIHRVEPIMEYFYNREAHCPRLKELLSQFRESKIAYEEKKRVKKYIEPSIRSALNLDSSVVLPSARVFYNTIDCLLTDGKPFVLNQKELRDIEEHAVWYYKERYSRENRIVGRLSISRVFDLLIQNIDARLASEQNIDPIFGNMSLGSTSANQFNNYRPYVSGNINTLPSRALAEIFVGHDQTLLPMLSVMNQRFTRWPGFGSWIGFETYKDKNMNDYYIRIIWDGEILDLSKNLKGEPTPMQAVTHYPELKNLYRYEDFRNWCLSEVVFEDYKSACISKPDEILFQPRSD